MRFKSDRQRKAVMAKLAAGDGRYTISRPAPSYRESGVRTSPRKPSLIDELNQKDRISEREVKLLQRRINDKKIRPDEIPANGYALSKEQERKGLNWLKDKGWTPKGKVRSNSPFGAREEDIVQNAREVRLQYFYSERPTQFGNWYSPVYSVRSKDGMTMEYTVSGGKVIILG